MARIKRYNPYLLLRLGLGQKRYSHRKGIFQLSRNQPMPKPKCSNCGTAIPQSCPKCGIPATRKPREPNAYNKFVAEQMKLPAVQALEPHNKMKAVAALWNQQKNKTPKS